MDEARDRLRGGPGIALLAIVVLAVAALIWLVAIRDDDSGELTAGGGPVLVDEGDLASVADDAGHPVYWVGPQEGTEIEATLTTDGRVFIRYLADGAEVGAEDPDFLTVGTYPFENAAQVLTELSQREGSQVTDTAAGGIAVSTAEQPESVYIASPDETLEIEVFDPDAARALELATSGAVVPVS